MNPALWLHSLRVYFHVLLCYLEENEQDGNWQFGNFFIAAFDCLVYFVNSYFLGEEGINTVFLYAFA